MEKERIKAKLNVIYDEILNHENYPFIKNNKLHLMEIFLAQADRLFKVNYNVRGYKGVYSYYKNGNNFLEIDLNQAPEFDQREELLEWFSVKLCEGLINLG